MSEIQCRKCGVTQPEDEFYLNTRAPSGRFVRCKSCCCEDEKIRKTRYAQEARGVPGRQRLSREINHSGSPNPEVQIERYSKQLKEMIRTGARTVTIAFGATLDRAHLGRLIGVLQDRCEGKPVAHYQSSHGYGKGYSFSTRKQAFQVVIQRQGTAHYGGSFDCEEDAAARAAELRQELAEIGKRRAA